MTRAGAFALCVFLASGVAACTARADAGHDHSAPEAGNAAAKGARIEAQSDLFELVAVVDGDALRIFLDRFATNEPVTSAGVEIEAGPLKGIAQPVPDGTYAIRNSAFTRPGRLPVTFTITAGADSDLLAGDLVIPEALTGAPEAESWLSRRGWWFGGASLVVLAGIAVAWRSLRQRVKGIAP